MKEKFDTDFEYDSWFEEMRNKIIINENEVEVNGRKHI